ncbi:MAG TPA: GNAT family N-acetyltransferase [Anaerolineales bacterium]|nr:GNAT family N-acetyltransferase [Anaerolineales bacterium]
MTSPAKRMNEINTSRLKLLELSLQQLKLCLFDLPEFERQTNIKIASAFITDRVQRAIRIKLEKMRAADTSQHAWITYWLIVIKEENVGAGMLGFKSYPTAEGSTEIGYGIDPAYQNKGYMSEAVQALIEWAFTHPFCRTITATEVYNPASKRLLEKLGAIQTEDNEKFTSWKILKT